MRVLDVDAVISVVLHLFQNHPKVPLHLPLRISKPTYHHHPVAPAVKYHHLILQRLQDVHHTLDIVVQGAGLGAECGWRDGDASVGVVVARDEGELDVIGDEGEEAAPRGMALSGAEESWEAEGERGSEVSGAEVGVTWVYQQHC